MQKAGPLLSAGNSCVYRERETEALVETECLHGESLAVRLFEVSVSLMRFGMRVVKCGYEFFSGNVCMSL